MATLVCDLCGGKLVMGAGGVAVCGGCDMEYNQDWLREKAQGIKGSVAVGNIASTENLLERARYYFNAFDFAKAEEYVNQVLDIEVGNEEARGLLEQITQTSAVAIPYRFTNKSLENKKSELNKEIGELKSSLVYLPDHLSQCEEEIRRLEKERIDWAARYGWEDKYVQSLGEQISGWSTTASDIRSKIYANTQKLHEKEAELKEVEEKLALKPLARLEKYYQGLVEEKNYSHDENSLNQIAQQFRELEGYKDSAALADECEQLGKQIADKRKQEAEEHQKSALYDGLCQKMNSAKADKNEKELPEIAGAFREMGEYKDAAALAGECEALAEQIRADKEKRYGLLAERLENAKKADRPDVNEFLDLSKQFAELGGYRISWALSDECAGVARQEQQKINTYNQLKQEFEKHNSKPCATVNNYRDMAKEYISLRDKFKELSGFEDAPNWAARCEEGAARCNQEADKIIAQKARKKLMGNCSALGVAGIIIVIYIAFRNMFALGNIISAASSGFLRLGGLLLLCFMPLSIGAIVFSICKIEKKKLQTGFIIAVCAWLWYFTFVIKYCSAMLDLLNTNSAITTLGFLYAPFAIAAIASTITLPICGMDSENLFATVFFMDIVYSIVFLIQALKHDSFWKLIIYLILFAIAAIVAALPSLLVWWIVAGIKEELKNQHGKSQGTVGKKKTATSTFMRCIAVICAAVATYMFYRLPALGYAFFNGGLFPMWVPYIIAFILLFRNKTRGRVLFAIIDMMWHSFCVWGACYAMGAGSVTPLALQLVAHLSSLILLMIWPKP